MTVLNKRRKKNTANFQLYLYFKNRQKQTRRPNSSHLYETNMIHSQVALNTTPTTHITDIHWTPMFWLCARGLQHEDRHIPALLLCIDLSLWSLGGEGVGRQCSERDCGCSQISWAFIIKFSSQEHTNRGKTENGIS